MAEARVVVRQYEVLYNDRQRTVYEVLVGVHRASLPPRYLRTRAWRIWRERVR